MVPALLYNERNVARPVQHIEATLQETSACDTSKHRQFIVVYMVTCTNDLGRSFSFFEPVTEAGLVG